MCEPSSPRAASSNDPASGISFTDEPDPFVTVEVRPKQIPLLPVLTTAEIPLASSREGEVTGGPPVALTPRSDGGKSPRSDPGKPTPLQSWHE